MQELKLMKKEKVIFEIKEEEADEHLDSTEAVIKKPEPVEALNTDL